ncbi:sensor histidine kinase [Ottowia sp.]|uniref:sensor histidine kinase n=1 Tax=Ottowia sp. TaxID=1898956 RepID=UPI003925677C
MSAAAPAERPARGLRARLTALAALWRRWRLWAVLGLVVAGLLGVLVWLARNHEIDEVQRALDRESNGALLTLRQGLARRQQDLHGLASTQTQVDAWAPAALALLDRHRDWLRLEWRDASLRLLAAADSPYYPPFVTDDAGPQSQQAQRIRETCASAQRFDGAAYSDSHFVQRPGGVGEEVMQLCLPIGTAARRSGFLLATYSLGGMLDAMLAPAYTQRQSVAFTELDGTRLAIQGTTRRPGRLFTSQQVLDLPGTTLVLRLEGGRQAPDTLPNVMTALVTGLSIALVTVLILLARDFRRRQQAEAELGEALAFRKAMENSLVTGLRARDLQGRITYVNPAFCDMVGFAPHELIGQALPAPYWPPEHAQEYGERQAVRLSGMAPPREGLESLFMRKDGTRIPVLIIEAPLIGAAGKQTGWMGAVLDLTAQRRAEEHSRASQDRLAASARLATVGEMASLMSHELNQPLAAISSYANGSLNLLDGERAPSATMADVRVALARIAEQAGRAGKVINSVHDLVRRRASQRQAVAPAALLEAVLPLIHLQARKLDVRVQLDCPATLPVVWCEPTVIEQVLLNLARNAMQAMADSAAPRLLRLTVQPALAPAGARGVLRFAVADTGAGISEEVARQLFTPFFTTKAEGMGLGLSLCRTGIEQHGGTLEHAPALPRGTVFSFTLTVADAVAHAPPAAPDERPAPRAPAAASGAAR